MLQDTLDVLRGHNLLEGERINRDALADLCKEVLLRDPIKDHDVAAVFTKALIVSEIRHETLGDVDSPDVELELDDLLRTVLTPEGKVQERLENGYVLCATQVQRRLSQNGSGGITIRRRGRFVTSDPDLIDEFYWNPAANRALSSVQSLNRRIELGARRQPALAARRAALVEKTWERVQLELPVKAGDES